MKYTTNRRINVRTIRNIPNEGGLTLRNGKIVEYKTGWQVGLQGITCTTPEEVSEVLHSLLGRKGNIGIWLSEGIYYIDISKRITTKQDAIAMGKLMNQQSIYSWRPRQKGQLVWCEKQKNGGWQYAPHFLHILHKQIFERSPPDQASVFLYFWDSGRFLCKLHKAGQPVLTPKMIHTGAWIIYLIKNEKSA